MQTEIKRINVHGYHYCSDKGYFDSKLKEIETLGVDEQYSLYIISFGDDEEGTKMIFENVFVKQKPNLIEMNLHNMKIFPNSFRLFTEKRWEKLIYI